MSKVDEMLVGRIHKGELKQTRDDLDKIIAAKINKKIEEKKAEFIENIKTAKGK